LGVDEAILAEEQAVRARSSGLSKEVEAEFGFGGESEGTLVLTNSRLVYVKSAEIEEDLQVTHIPSSIGGAGGRVILFSDVEELESIQPDPANLSIPLKSLSSVKGKKGMLGSPKLEVQWNTGSRMLKTEFVQQITGRSRKKNLSDWAEVVEGLKNGTLKLETLPPLPDRDSVERKILRVLGDMQEKGVLTITSGLQTQLGLKIDSDEVQSSCEKLVSEGFLSKSEEFKEDPFYRRISPLGAADLFG